MKYVNLGRSGLKVSRLCLGCMSYGEPEHLSTAISALDFSLSDAEITELEARYLPHPVDGIIPPLPDTPPSLTPPSAIQNY